MEFTRRRYYLPRWACRLGIGLLILLSTGSFLGGCSSGPSGAIESPRLHVIAVLYGRYLSAHDGQMPADRDEFIAFINANAREVLLRRGFNSAEEILAESADKPRLIVLYRDLRERLQTEYTVIEEQPYAAPGSGGSVARRWFAADQLGIAREIDKEQAQRVLAEAG
jgi:hypothetical protein